MVMSLSVPAWRQKCNRPAFCEYPPMETGRKRTGITIVTFVTCAAGRHGRAGDLAGGMTVATQLIRARLPGYRPRPAIIWGGRAGTSGGSR
jgi:hypothetical protein